MRIEIIPTVEYKTSFIDEVLHDSLISGIRINTGYNFFSDSCNNKMYELINYTRWHGKKLWMDLKGRELRILYAQNNDECEQWVKINHKIQLNTPAEFYFNDGAAYSTITKLRRKRNLKINTPVPINFGKGTPINIPNDSLSVLGYYTKTDYKIMKLAKKHDVHDYMISFVESPSDIEELLRFDPKANIVAKIESKKGLEFVKEYYPSYSNRVQLMAARGDMFVELDYPHEIISALEDIIEADSGAMVGSRIYSSVARDDLMPSCTDITDIQYLLDLGYRSFLLGDEIREKREYVLSAIGVIKALVKQKEKKEVRKKWKNTLIK
jgi:hypothetical protein